jgi:hypothetical protein
VMFAALLLMGLAGCHGAEEKAPQDPADEVPPPVAAPPAMENGMNLESQVAAARADLGERLEVPASEIELLEARHVTWSDSSLGCPQPGMAYMQVLTPGVLIRLGAAGQEYRYHGGARGRPALCRNPEGKPLPGLEDR